jgi:Bax protein
MRDLLQQGPTRRNRGYLLRLWGIAGICLVLLVILVLLLVRGPLMGPSMPDFREIADVSERKEAFFTFLEPFVEAADAEIQEQRVRLLKIEGRVGDGHLNRRDDRWIRGMAADYGVEIDPEAAVDPSHVAELLRRVDIIPPSLALAQAALESGWGTSRFAQKGNNLFGIWCYTPGCGIVPQQRPAGATYEVTKYSSPRESFEDYIRNLNSNRSYQALWELRETLRAAGRPVTGLGLVDGLYRYSEEGWAYVGKVQSVIQSNNLSQYDETE